MSQNFISCLGRTHLFSRADGDPTRTGVSLHPPPEEGSEEGGVRRE